MSAGGFTTGAEKYTHDLVASNGAASLRLLDMRCSLSLLAKKAWSTDTPIDSEQMGPLNISVKASLGR